MGEDRVIPLKHHEDRYGSSPTIEMAKFQFDLTLNTREIIESHLSQMLIEMGMSTTDRLFRESPDSIEKSLLIAYAHSLFRRPLSQAENPMELLGNSPFRREALERDIWHPRKIQETIKAS